MLNQGSRSFRPAWPVSIIAAIGLAIFIAMGLWQVRRGEEKMALQQRLDQRSQGPVIEIPARPLQLANIEYARVSARGEFLPKFTILLDNRVVSGVVGYQILTPLKLAGGDLCVLVNRGWIAASARRDELPQIVTAEGPQLVEGLAMAPKRFFELGQQAPTGPVWQNVTIERYATATGLKLQPFLLQQLSPVNDVLIRVPERPDTGIEKHQGYAFQWFAFAALTVILYIALNFKPNDHGKQ
jgi:surfeit locus 1 family protein